MFTQSQLTLRWRLHGFWRSLKCHVTDVKNITGMTRIDRNSANTKVYAYEIKQNISKNFFLPATNAAAIGGIAHWFFSCYHWQWLLFSHSKHNFSTTLTPPKNRDIHIVEFFVDSIYSKTIDMIRKNIFFLYLHRWPMCKADDPDNCAIWQVAL